MTLIRFTDSLWLSAVTLSLGGVSQCVTAGSRVTLISRRMIALQAPPSAFLNGQRE